MVGETIHEEESESMTKVNTYNSKGTDIQEFYKDCNVFVTGGTGFLGKLLIEKLLRSCPAINKIFVIIRPKKGKLPETRKDELIKCVVFDVLKTTNPDFHQKLVMVPGDCSLPKIGLSPSDYEMLTQQVNIIFHLAATVRFDEKFNIAVPINIGGTKEIIDLGRTCVNLKSMVYVSTAYCNCPLKEIKECFYDPPLDAEEDINYLSTTDEAVLEVLKYKILGVWPNTYTFTKSIAEDIIRKNASDLPISIVRPSQVVSTMKDPLCGWINNIYGAVGAFVGFYLGLIKSGLIDGNKKQDIIPADLCINSLIAAAYDRATRNHKDIPIYNNVSGKHSLTFNESASIVFERICEIPSKQAIWYPWAILTRTLFWYRLLAIILHVIPAVYLDLVFMLKRKSPMLLKSYRKINQYLITMKYFSTFEWNFDNNKCKNLYNSLSENDKEIFYFDSSTLEWKSYFKNLVYGGRLYLLNESIETLPAGKAQFKKFYIAHQTIKMILIGLVAWILWGIVAHRLKLL